MPIKSKYLFVASMDVDPDKETLFNEVYDTEHVPNLLKVPGVHAVARMEGEPFAMSIGGEQRMVVCVIPPGSGRSGDRLAAPSCCRRSAMAPPTGIACGGPFADRA